jgi:hypothetical protein
MQSCRVNIKLVLSLIVSLQVGSAFCQTRLPGGVSGALVWEITESLQSGQALWKSMLASTSDTAFHLRGRAQTINSYPALLFSNGTNAVDNTLNLGKMTSFSLFTVCHESDTTSERVIFSIGNDTASQIVLTNRRMAALDIYHYTNYTNGIITYPKIYSYLQNKSIDTRETAQNLQFGRPPGNQQLPVSHYNGIMPEVILFARVISPPERQRVESYLALKYGITLNQEFPVSYLNSTGEIIWDAELYAAHSNSIAGLGRDDTSGLNQRVSESTQNPGVLKVGAIGEMKNNSFLIWGDNGEALRFDEEEGIRRMVREWRFSAFNYKGGTVNLATNELSFHDINPLLPGETYWVMIDRSATGKYPFGATDYVRSLPSPYPGKTISFNSVMIDTDHSGSDLFTIIAAPSFFARSIVLSPSCSSSDSGAIQCEVAGGTPPFNILLKGITNNLIRVSANDESRYHHFDGLRQGEYRLLITDAEGKEFTGEIRVSNSHLWENNISRSYTILEGESLVLNASAGMPSGNYFYSWTLPDGSLFNSEEIKIERAGNYLLSVTDAGNCSSTIEVKVRETSQSGIGDTELFPNPANGWFALRISLEWEMDINVIITDISGKLIRQTQLRNSRYYLYNDLINEPGSYLITLVTDTGRETLKLIVQ